MSEIKQYTEESLARLRRDMEWRLSPFRYSHTLGVEKTAGELAELYGEQWSSLLRAAALLHDVTKEYPTDRQKAVLSAAGIELRPDEAASPKIFHSITGPIIIRKEFPEFADPILLSSVRWHTTGHAGVTLPEALLYLADYIEDGRTFADCLAVRNRFYDGDPRIMGREARLSRLREALLYSFELNILDLESAHIPVCADTLEARSYLLRNEQPFGKDI